MADLENFDKLVSNLTLGERQSLLEKLNGQSTLSNEPLYFQEDEKYAIVRIEEKYSKLPWYLRFWYMLIGFFKSKSSIDIFRDKQTELLGKQIDALSPGLYDFQKRLLLRNFFVLLNNLKEASRYFYSALDISVNRDRSSFYAFLASLEMPEVHRILQNETDPLVITEKNPNISDADLRQKAHSEMENAFERISDDHRASMYKNARSLFCLRNLSSFLFDRVLMAFRVKSEAEGEICSINVVRELLVNLDNILFSLKSVPSMALLESLFIFAMQDRSREAGFDLSREISAQLSKAEAAISVIRDFNRRIPLTWILRCSSRDMSLSPYELSGGEDWLLIFKDYWRKRVDSLCTEYIKNRRQKELLNSFRIFLDGNELVTLENIQSSSSSEGFPLEEAFTLSLLLSFHLLIFIPKINKVLLSVMNDGKFSKKEHWGEFTGSYNTLLRLEDKIKKLDSDISPDGDYGSRYVQARQEMSSITIKRRKIQIIVDEASIDAEKLIEQILDASDKIVNILLAMPEKDASIDEVISQFQKLHKLLNDIAGT